MNKEQELYLYTAEQGWDELRQEALGRLITQSALLSHEAALDVLRVANQPQAIQQTIQYPEARGEWHSGA